MKGINQHVKLAIEILTPVQSGSGAELFKELDFIERSGAVFIVDQQQSFSAIVSGDLNIDALLEKSLKLSDLVLAAGQDFGYRLPWLSSPQKVPDKFREQLKDATNRPYLPGSAIKGAIRTALIAEWIRTAGKSDNVANSADPTISIAGLLPDKYIKPKKAANKLMEKLVGQDAMQDIFRSFKVKDAYFSDTDLRLADIRWLNENRWRSMSKRKSMDNWQEADGLYAEVLQANALALVIMQWDGFLLSDTAAWQHADTVGNNIAPQNFDDLKQRLNQHAKYRLQREIDYYKAQSKPAPENECKRLLALLETQNNCAYLQMSWGSGWRGMTGDCYTEEQVKTFREIFKLGRTGKPFPKTRRLVVSGEPKLPLGWIRLMPYELVADKLAQQQSQQDRATNQSAWVNQKVAQIAQQNHSGEKDALRGKALAEVWQALPDGDEKQLALADIKSRWQTEDWWDSPNGRSAKQAKAIYESKQ